MPTYQSGGAVKKKISFAMVTLLIQSTGCIAGAGMPCEKLEYARLKDSTKKELVSEYCSATGKARLNEDLYAISKESFDRRIAMGSNVTRTMQEMSEKGEAQVSCVRAAEDASAMLLKKFKAKPLACK
jgi:hypothetical protein